ncbi:MAG: NADP-dependent phosphogluconate dehydrogenase [bacterium]
MEPCHIGLIGLAVMGRNLVLNLESRGYKVAVYNRTAEKTREFMDGDATGRNIYSAEDLAGFAGLLERPRRILLMVQAGEPVDRMLAELVKVLEPGDVIADGGNSHYKDTERRAADLQAKGIHYLGAGISGGEEGALKGPSIMIGGPEEGFRLMEGPMSSIAARAGDEPCAARLGPGGAGHLVKMVHNGIEYAVMQAIAEVYHFLKTAAGMENHELSRQFQEYNQGELRSYLVEITAPIFASKDPETGKDMIDVVLDQAGQKGTGRWTVETALTAAVPVPVISAAVEARGLSARREQRITAARALGPEGQVQHRLEKQQAADMAAHALLASMLCAYAQGMNLLREMSGERGYDIPLSTVAAIWREGCIIRARLLETIRKAYQDMPDLQSILLYPQIAKKITEARKGLAKTVQTGAESGIPMPAISASLAYLDGLRSEWLPANLIQAQRDYFGAHTFQRVDKEGTYHHDWPKPDKI